MAYLAQGTPVDDAAFDHPRMNWGAIFAGWLVATGKIGRAHV